MQGRNTAMHIKLLDAVLLREEKWLCEIPKIKNCFADHNWQTSGDKKTV